MKPQIGDQIASGWEIKSFVRSSAADRYRPQIELECIHCGSKKIERPARLLTTRSCLCAKPLPQRTENLVGQRFGQLVVIAPDPISTKRLVKWICRCDCGKVKSIRAGEMKRRTRSCGCQQKVIASLLCGPLSAVWNPNLTDEQRHRNRSKKEYTWFAQKTYAKSDFRCVRCGCTKTKDNTLCAHHINPKNWLPEIAYDVSNGVALCACCHKEYHSLYGIKAECNRVTLELWMNGKAYV